MERTNQKVTILDKSKELIRNQKYFQAEELLKSLPVAKLSDTRILELLGISAMYQNKFDQAQQYLNDAQAIQPQSAEVYYYQGKLFERQGKYQQSVNNYQRAIQLKKDYFEAYFSLGNVLRKIGKKELALNSYNIALNINSSRPEIYLNIGIILEEEEQLQSAINIFQKLVNKFPDYLEGCNKLGICLKKAGFFEQAEQIFRTGLDRDENYVRFYGNLGNVLQSQGKFQEALNLYNQAIDREPKYYEAIFSRSLLHLLMGKFKKGWQDYEYRWKLSGLNMKDFDFPIWDGQNLDNKSLLLWSEQGFGDSIQFIRYAPLIKKEAGQLICACQSSLHKLFSSIPEIDKIVDAKLASSQECDFHLPMLSLPRVFQTTLESIPASVPYLYVDRSVQNKIDEKIDIDENKFNIGIVWSGNSDHHNDHRRSCKLQHFNRLDKIDGVQLYSLQKGEARQQLSQNKTSNIINLAPIIDDFSDTAALVKRLDLVISVDTSVAHLAGAINKEVWLILPNYPDWRWLLDRDDSPWYPSMQIFRQSEPGDWQTLFQNMGRRLQNRIRAFQFDFESIHNLINSGALEKAEAQIQKILENNPNCDQCLYLLSGVKRRQKFYPRAKQYIEKAIDLAPERSSFYHELGLNEFFLGEYIKAQESFLKAISKNTENLPSYLMAGKSFIKTDEFDQAIFYLQKYLEAKQDNQVTFLVSRCYFHEGNYEKAVKYLEKAKNSESANYKIYNMLGQSYQALDELDHAKKSFQQGLENEPNSEELHNNLGKMYQSQEEWSQARHHYKKAFQINPDHYPSNFNLGKLEHEQDNLNEAIKYYRQALEIKPELAAPLNNMSSIFLKNGDYRKALSTAKKAHTLAPKESTIQITLGNAFNKAGQYQKAIQCYNQVLKDDPYSAEVHTNLGSTYFNMRNLEKSRHHLDEAIQCNPSSVNAHWNRALTYLSSGKFIQGWREYEWRWKKKSFQAIKQYKDHPHWDGYTHKEESLLIWAEQGFGDTIQFVRLIQRARPKVKKIFLQVPPPLQDIMESVKGVDKVISSRSTPPRFQIHCPLLSLPNLLHFKYKNIPNQVPYLKVPQSDQKQLFLDNHALKVGIIWAGDENHKNDHFRSCRLSHFTELAGLEEVEFYSLQKKPGHLALAEIEQKQGFHDLSGYINDFSDTAWIIDQLDLVISVDTAVAHLSGALGQKTWILLPRNSDWRWFDNKTKTPWYPTAKLFRQEEQSNWESVFEKVRMNLKKINP
ncbi:MAG TPA: tetratricopeptide repeat protein [bacterium]|nr:tetratricopeptide repeat protein [bacterium]